MQLYKINTWKIQICRIYSVNWHFTLNRHDFTWSFHFHKNRVTNYRFTDLQSSSWCLACSWWLLWPGSWETPSGKYDKHSSKSFPSVRNQGISIRRRADNMTEGDACKLRDSSGQFIGRLVQDLLCEQQRGTCTHTTKYFVSNLRWGCQSHRFAWNKGYERIE
jgi:hypothetical protein